jgi:hypothetical protein
LVSVETPSDDRMEEGWFGFGVFGSLGWILGIGGKVVRMGVLVAGSARVERSGFSSGW